MQLVPYRLTVLASLVLALGSAGLPVPAAAGPITVSSGTTTLDGSVDHSNDYVRMTGGTLQIQSGTNLGMSALNSTGGLNTSVESSGGQVNIQGGAQFAGGLTFTNSSTANVGVGGSGQATITGLAGYGNAAVSLDQVTVTGTTADSTAPVTLQGSSFVSTTANTTITSVGPHDAVDLGDTSSMELNGSHLNSDLSGILISDQASATLNNVTINAKGDGVWTEGGVTKISNSIVNVSNTLPSSNSPITGINGVGLVTQGRFNNQNPTVTVNNSQITVSQGNGSATAGLALVADDYTAPVTTVNNSIVRADGYGAVFGVDPLYNNPGTGVSTLNLSNSVLQANKNAAIWVQSNSQANVNIQNSQLLPGNGVVLQTDAGSTTNLAVTNSMVSGNVVNNGGNTNLTLNANGVWKGTMQNVSSLTLNPSSNWVLTNSSTLNQLNNNGRIDLSGTQGNQQTLTVTALNGKGTFGLNTDIAGQQSDKLAVSGQGQANGLFSLDVKAQGASPATKGPITVVKTNGGPAQFQLTNGMVDLGAYRYGLQQNGMNWNLVPLKNGNYYSSSATSVLNLVSTSPTIWYGQVRTLQSRFGELRFEEDHGGVWARPYASDYRVDGAANSTFEQKQAGIAMGADKGFTLGSGKAYLGGVFNYSASSLDNNAGATGDVDAYSLGAYGVWLAPNGFYLHGLVTLNQYHNRGEATMSNGVNTAGTYHQNGVGASVEAGKRFQLQKDWFVQPYVQVAGVRMNGATVALDNGMQAQSNHVESLQGSVGTSFGKLLHTASGGTVEPYVRLAVTHEFVENNTVIINGSAFDANLNGSRVELGLGASGQINKHLSAHIDYSYAKGPVIEKPYMIDAGLRYQW
ncbi:hypothetical protein CXB49_00235 [Chromobacterium sp. ATCC 53434]|uniref:autotransporter outer membrane beta-barrel domain-containing protein n=1 Tax=Chromobacterium sp. (strain ATCC 53434 / SC 14030) TaxID=2059672 RepID=UPI000C75D397|nr:autotransporter outer membrane beta-barrel domain-containing protein [Chromobacterium sp. ATCC 53434]AUH49375.1 hypothetical protein CXB49_00235 [Chromobacterium sp. ATCC 53434]